MQFFVTCIITLFFIFKSVWDELTQAHQKIKWLLFLIFIQNYFMVRGFELGLCYFKGVSVSAYILDMRMFRLRTEFRVYCV